MVSQAIILETLIHVKRRGKHRHKYLLVDQDRLKNKLVALFDGLVVVLHVEEYNHLFVIMFVRGQPESELVAAGLLRDRIVGNVACD